MVNKVVVIDTRTPFSGNCGTTTVGQYFRKAQTGGDSPSLPRRKKGQPRRRFYVGTSSEHEYTMDMERLIDFPITWGDKRNPGMTFSGTLPSCGFAPEDAQATFDSNDDNELVNKLYSQVAGSDFNLAVTLAQSAQSLELIGSGALRVSTALTALRHRDFAKLAATLGVPVSPRHSGSKLTKKSSQNLTSAWLEYRYGWEPLLTDVHDAAKLLALQLSSPQVKVFKQTKVKQATRSSSANGLYGYSQPSIHIISKQVTYKCSEGPSISGASLSGLLDPLSVAWELVPYSFVVDWFYPIGNYLEARSSLSKLTGTFITSTKTTRRRGGNVYPLGDIYTTFISQSVPFSYTSVNLKRNIGPPSILPPTLIPFGEALSWKRAVSALSLLNNFT